MSRQRIPDEVLSTAHARSAAREARDWAEADRLRAEIEAAGWRIADRGPDGSHVCDLDIAPGLAFKVKAADLDPFLSLLEWAGR